MKGRPEGTATKCDGDVPFQLDVASMKGRPRRNGVACQRDGTGGLPRGRDHLLS